MRIHLPTHRRTTVPGSRTRRATRLSAALAGLAAPALIAGAVAAPASASSTFETRLTPLNTFYLMLDVSGASTQPGAPVIDWYANGGANQNWTFVPQGGYDEYEIINQNSGQCLTTDGVAGDQVYQFPCVGSTQQLWYTSLIANLFYNSPVQSAYSGLYLDVNGDSAWPGTAVDTWYWNGQNNQNFSAI